MEKLGRQHGVRSESTWTRSRAKHEVDGRLELVRPAPQGQASTKLEEVVASLWKWYERKVLPLRSLRSFPGVQPVPRGQEEAMTTNFVALLPWHQDHTTKW